MSDRCQAAQLVSECTAELLSTSGLQNVGGGACPHSDLFSGIRALPTARRIPRMQWPLVLCASGIIRRKLSQTIPGCSSFSSKRLSVRPHSVFRSSVRVRASPLHISNLSLTRHFLHHVHLPLLSSYWSISPPQHPFTLTARAPCSGHMPRTRHSLTHSTKIRRLRIANRLGNPVHLPLLLQ